MSNITIYPSVINGTVIVPASKSYSQRVCAAALLKGGKSVIKNYGSSNDEKIALEIIKQLGATIEIENNILTITSSFNPFKKNNCNNLFVDESGLSLRLFTPIASLLSNEILITGRGSLLNRTIEIFDTILPQLNVAIQSNNGKLPITVCGNMQMKNIELDGAISSQFLTGFLMCYSFLSNNFLLENDVIIKVHHLKSKPYIDVTIDVLKDFGLPIPINKWDKEFVFEAQNSNKKNTETIYYSVEGDWSSAAFLLVAAAIAGNITLQNININSKQADKKIVEILQKCGCAVEINENEITVAKPQIKLQCFEFNATDCPDLFPVLVALAINCEGSSKIKGVNRLVHKESNRGEVLKKEFAKMGVEILLQNDEMIVKGSCKINGAVVNSNDDHRIAMACAIAALNASDKVIIEHAEAVNKSYPNFYKDLASIGVVLVIK